MYRFEYVGQNFRTKGFPKTIIALNRNPNTPSKYNMETARKLGKKFPLRTALFHCVFHRGIKIHPKFGNLFLALKCSKGREFMHLHLFGKFYRLQLLRYYKKRQISLISEKHTHSMIQKLLCGQTTRSSGDRIPASRGTEEDLRKRNRLLLRTKSKGNTARYLGAFRVEKQNETSASNI